MNPGVILNQADVPIICGRVGLCILGVRQHGQRPPQSPLPPVRECTPDAQDFFFRAALKPPITVEILDEDHKVRQDDHGTGSLLREEGNVRFGYDGSERHHPHTQVVLGLAGADGVEYAPDHGQGAVVRFTVGGLCLWLVGVRTVGVFELQDAVEGNGVVGVEQGVRVGQVGLAGRAHVAHHGAFVEVRDGLLEDSLDRRGERQPLHGRGVFGAVGHGGI